MANDSIAIVILAGELGGSLFEESARAKRIVCADGAADRARSMGIACHVIVGDLDSVSSDTREYFARHGAEILRVPDQDHNDFEKSMEYLMAKWSGVVHIYGLTGGRLDHTLTNLSIMLRYSDRFHDLIAIDDVAEYRFLTDAKSLCSIECPIDTTISLVPFGEAQGVVTNNLLYPLRAETLRLGAREGLSNRATASPVTIAIEQGALLIAVQRR
ncbi:MAG: thiamine diphosphokinase [Acidobacteriaceae bacterium]